MPSLGEAGISESAKEELNLVGGTISGNLPRRLGSRSICFFFSITVFSRLDVEETDCSNAVTFPHEMGLDRSRWARKNGAKARCSYRLERAYCQKKYERIQVL